MLDLTSAADLTDAVCLRFTRELYMTLPRTTVESPALGPVAYCTESWWVELARAAGLREFEFVPVRVN